jgi:predicted KAP-like P-loop ATPase
MTEDLLQKKNTVKTVWFDAWKFDKTHDLRVALIDAVLRRIQKDETIDDTLKEKVGDLLKKINWLDLGKIVLSSFLPASSVASQVMGTLIKSLFKNPEDIPEKTLELIGEFEDRFKDITREYIGDKGRLLMLSSQSICSKTHINLQQYYMVWQILLSTEKVSKCFPE